MGNGCLLWGLQVIVSSQCHKPILQLLHEHKITSMKSLARLHVWWPSLDSDIESSCVNCAESAKEPTKD